jgi:RNA-directed DNA polymerase
VPERATVTSRSEKSAAAVVAGNREGPNEGESETTVSLAKPRHQKPAAAGSAAAGRGEAPNGRCGSEGGAAAHGNERSGNGDLMERIVARDNLLEALRRVRRNRGSPGVDGMTVEELSGYLKEHWRGIREQLLAGTYRPQAVLRCEIPKSGGGQRTLGIPTVVDRFIQQAILQVLQPCFDPTFSDSSYGFRPGRRAQDAVRQARTYIQQGRRFVVDIDLEQFFDRVNHDVLMGRLAKRVGDKRLLRLIRRYLQAGVMADGVVIERHQGTPQGGPLSPLLANVLLDEVDRELERRGHAFVRYADDCNVYVRSRASGERVMAGLRRMYEKLHLRINEAKSAVAPATHRPFLGFSFWRIQGEVRYAVADKALQALKVRVRQITARNGGRSLIQVAAELREYLLGWKAYFRLAQTPRVFRTLDEWLRHRLRALQLKQWKRGTTIYRELRKRGAPEAVARTVAANCRRWWRNSALLLNSVLSIAYFDTLGVPRLAA